MINNLKEVQSLLEFGDNTYYYLQVIQRRKDPGNSEMKSGEQQKWSKFITSPTELEKVWEDVQGLCKLFKARAYIELNPRCLEKFSIEMARRLLDRIYLHDYTRIASLRNKVALSEETIRTRGIIPGRRWTVDIDHPEDYKTIIEWTKENKVNVISEMPTPNGKHLVVEAFNYKTLGIELDREFVVRGSTKTTVKPFANTVLYYNSL